MVIVKTLSSSDKMSFVKSGADLFLHINLCIHIHNSYSQISSYTLTFCFCYSVSPVLDEFLYSCSNIFLLWKNDMKAKIKQKQKYTV